ncbi:MAG: acyltransferase [Magnetococcales bacterium]|nr:acyltransferase [Magnetococcales bacterium]
MTDIRPVVHSLNGLRGWAALAVVFMHLTAPFYAILILQKASLSRNAWDLWLAKTPLFVLFNGWFAVMVFFVLSGYVLSSGYFATRRREVVFSSLLRRYFRLAIPILASSVLVFLILKYGRFFHLEIQALGGDTTLGSLYHFPPDFLDLLSHSLWQVFQGSNKYNHVLWTMRIELIGSFLVFAILLLVGDSRLRFLLYLYVLVYWWNIYLKCFVAGLVMADLHVNLAPPALDRRDTLRDWLFGGLFLSGLLLGSYPYRGDDPSAYQQQLVSVTRLVLPGQVAGYFIGAVLLVAGALYAPGVARFLGNRLSRFLGEVSFSIYLIHVPITYSIGFGLFLDLRARGLGDDPAFLIYFATTVPLVLGAGWLFHRLVDRPGIQAMKWLYARLRDIIIPPPATAPAAASVWTPPPAR